MRLKGNIDKFKRRLVLVKRAVSVEAGSLYHTHREGEGEIKINIVHLPFMPKTPLQLSAKMLSIMIIKGMAMFQIYHVRFGFVRWFYHACCDTCYISNGYVQHSFGPWCWRSCHGTILIEWCVLLSRIAPGYGHFFCCLMFLTRRHPPAQEHNLGPAGSNQKPIYFDILFSTLSISCFWETQKQDMHKVGIKYGLKK